MYIQKDKSHDLELSKMKNFIEKMELRTSSIYKY